MNKNERDFEIELTESLTIELQEALHEVEKQKVELEESRASEYVARLAAEEAARITEEELFKEMSLNADLQKGEGMKRISMVSVFGIIIICLTPGLYLFAKMFIEWHLINIGEIDNFSDSKESWNVFENFGIYVIGTLSGLLLGFFGLKSFSGSEGKTAVKVSHK